MRRFLALAAVVALVGCKPVMSDGERAAPAVAGQPEASTTSSAVLPECSKRFRLVTDKPLSLIMYSQLGLPRSVSTVPSDGERLTLTYQGFDNEDGPMEGNDHGFGVVYVRSDRPGAPVLGGVIWVNDIETLYSGSSTLEAPSWGGLYLTARAPDALGTTNGRAACQGDYVVKFDEEDRALYADGVRIGALP